MVCGVAYLPLASVRPLPFFTCFVSQCGSLAILPPLPRATAVSWADRPFQRSRFDEQQCRHRPNTKTRALDKVEHVGHQFCPFHHVSRRLARSCMHRLWLAKLIRLGCAVNRCFRFFSLINSSCHSFLISFSVLDRVVTKIIEINEVST